ncbi:pentapeptide repeat-containing protein [Nocardia cyriacigeorgica]|uniref:pentapeptide repeat-containing protein n=1 Tax=Nocardia cyriacigeorgica TaxID=135487 RepID=UPI002B4AF746|nr:pentapeptide repeat-containing protein [Nocardia cyriacigeorgica]
MLAPSAIDKGGLIMLEWMQGRSRVVSGIIGLIMAALLLVVVVEWSGLQPGQGAVIGGGAVLGGALVTFYAQHRNRISEEIRSEASRIQSAEHFERTHSLDQIQALRERFVRSTEQLGNSAPATRLAGVYSLTALADDWYETYGDDHLREVQVCINVLCAYLRTKGDPSREERVVRAAIWNVLRMHRPQRGPRNGSQVLVPDPPPPGSRRHQQTLDGHPPPGDWGWATLDLAGADLTDFELSFMDLSNSDLSSANLCAAQLEQTELYESNLDGADLSNIKMYRVKLSGASLRGVDLHDAQLEKVRFDHTDLQGADMKGVRMGDSTLSHANLNRANLSYAAISGTNMIGARVLGTIFTGAECYFSADDYEALECPEFAIDLVAPQDVEQ